MLSNNEMWWHINQDYVLPLASFTLKGPKNSNFQSLLTIFNKICSNYRYLNASKRRITYSYDEGSKMLNYKELVLADILDKRNADIYNFDTVYDLFVSRKKG